MLKLHASSCQCFQNTTRAHEELRVFKEETSLIPFALIKHYTNGRYPRRIFKAYAGDISSGKPFSDDMSLESCKSPTAVLFDVDTGSISIVTVNTKEYHFDVLAISQG
ncbi:hypothetical protein Tco_1352997 [Tanacetum coccineum]